MHGRAPGRPVDAEHPGVEQRHQQRPQGGGKPQVGQHVAGGRGGRVVRVGQLPEQRRRDPQAERDRQAQEQPAYLPALGPVGAPVAQREQHHPDQRPGREGAVHRLGGSAQRRQGRHPQGAVQDRGHAVRGSSGRRDVGLADRLEQREQESRQRHRPDDDAFVGAFGPPGREQAEQADAGHRAGHGEPVLQQRDRRGRRGGNPPVVLGHRQEHVPERRVAAERDADADQPPDHPVLRLAQEPGHAEHQERHGPDQEPVDLRAVAGGDGHDAGGEDHPAAERRERGDYGPHASIVRGTCGKAP